MSILFDIGLIIVVAMVFSYIAKALRQPLVVAYVLAGVLIGPVGLGLITNIAEINVLAELGIAFLLFTVGLEMDIPKLRAVGKASLIGASIQMALTFVLGFSLGSFLGFNALISVYTGLLLAFSSTMIVAKILVDRGEISTLHGRIMMGILLIQDVVVVLTLPMLSSMPVAIFSPEVIVLIVLKALGLFGLAVALNKFVFRRVLDWAAETREILFFTAVATCFSFIGLAYVFGFSIAIGAFIGGIALANFPYTLEIFGEMHSLRDFFSVIFFTSLGMQFNIWIVSEMISPFLILLLVTIFAKPLILSVIYLFLGYGGRTSSMLGLGLGQASEFSFIIAAQGLLLGQLSPAIYSLILGVVVISMVATPYFVISRNAFYNLFSKLYVPGMDKLAKPKYIRKLERNPKKEMSRHIVILGCDVMGKKVTDFLRSKRKEFIVVEHNPETIKNLNRQGVYCVYGNADDEDVLKRVGLYRANTAVITIPNISLATFIAAMTRKHNPKAKILARAYTKEDAKNLYKAGADFVVVPDIISGNELVKKISGFL